MKKATGQPGQEERAVRQIQIEEFSAQRWSLPLKWRPEVCGFEDTRIVSLSPAHVSSREFDLGALVTEIREKLAA